MGCVRVCLTLAASLLIVCASAWAQTSLAGGVVDPRGAIVAQATPSLRLSYRPVNDDSFMAESLVVEEPSSVYREHLQFKHHRRPLTDLAEVAVRVTGGIEQNIVLGWEGQHYRNRSHTTPDGDVEEAETQPDLNLPLARVTHFPNSTNALHAQDYLTLRPKVVSNLTDTEYFASAAAI